MTVSPHSMAPTEPTTTAASSLTIVVFSGEMDRLQAAFTMAAGAAACGMDVTMFFTFWGITVLRTEPTRSPKSGVERMLGWLLPAGADGTRLSRLNMAGLGRWLMTRQMRKKGLPSLRELIAISAESGVRFGVCESTMALLGIARSELMAGVDLELCGVARVWDRAAGGQIVFI